MDGVTTAQLGKLLNIGPRRVSQLAAIGVLPRAGRNRYDASKCAVAYIKYLQSEIERRPPAAKAATAALRAARHRLLKAQTERLDLRNAVRRGDLLEAEDVRAGWTARLGNARQRLRTIPAALGPQLLNISDPALIVARWLHEIDQALAELIADSGGYKTT